MKKRIIVAKAEIEEENIQLEKVRVNKQFREKLSQKIKDSNKKVNGSSINIDTDTPLLSGDHDEEVRQQDRVA